MDLPRTRLFRVLSNAKKTKWRLAVKSILVGAMAGLLAVLYRIAVEKGRDFAVWMYAYIRVNPLALIPWAAAACGVGFLIAWLIKLEPMAAGGGVPQVKGLILYGLKMKWRAVIAVRYIAGILGSLFGLSFGPEGPSIQIGAAVSQGAFHKFCETKIEENYLITAGAAAGLATAFSAPLTGMIFALEEIHRNFSPTVLLSATGASLTADFISKYFFGMKPVLFFQTVPEFPLQMYYLLILLGLFSGLAGVATNRGMLLFQTLYLRIPLKFRPLVALAIALPCGLFLPEVLGGGSNLFDVAQNTTYSLQILLILLIVKILFSSTSFGSGTPGGIFMPIIAISALSGGVFSSAASGLGLTSQYLPVFVICAMAGGLTSCVKAPITSIILTVELTGSFIHILPVAICSFVALFLSDILNTAPIYEALLKRYVERNGCEIPSDKRGELVELPVEYGSEIANQRLADIAWPKGSLIVGLRRGTEEIIPRGDTKIMAGDYLLVMSPRERCKTVREKIDLLCRSNV